jgi:hypothetical protein
MRNLLMRMRNCVSRVLRNHAPRFLQDTRADSSVEWIVVVILVVAVVGSMIYNIANTTNTQGSGTNTWIGNIPAPTSP